MTAVTTSDTALTRLRDQLTRRGFTVTDDAITAIGKYGQLRLTDRLEVWCGPEWYRWAGGRGGWRFVPVTDPDHAARQLTETLARDRAVLAAWLPGWTFRQSDTGRWHAARVIYDRHSRAIDADDLDQLLTHLLRQDELARTLP